MAVNPATVAAIAAVVGPLLQGLFSDDDTPRRSFAGTGPTSPTSLMRRNLDFQNKLGGVLADRAAQPVTLRSAYAQTPGAYTGGGLPFPIGVTAQDPALKDPSLLTLPGIKGLEGLFNGLGDGLPGFGVVTGPTPTNPPGGNPGITGPDGFGPDGKPLGGFEDFYLPDFTQQTPQNPNGTTDGGEPTPSNQAEMRGTPSMDVFPRRRPTDEAPGSKEVVGGEELIDFGVSGQPGDDLSRALGSIQLLLSAYEK